MSAFRSSTPFQDLNPTRALFCPAQKGGWNSKLKGKYKIVVSNCLTGNAPHLDFKAFGRCKTYLEHLFLIREEQRRSMAPAPAGRNTSNYLLFFYLRHRSITHTYSLHPFYNSWWWHREPLTLQATTLTGHLLYLQEDILWHSRHCGGAGNSTPCLRHHLLSMLCQTPLLSLLL